MSKATILADVVAWLHNDAAAAQTEVFWSRAKDAIAGDVFGVDSSVTDWDLTHCVAHPSIWFYAALVAGHVFTRDAEGLAGAQALYKDEVARVGTAPALRGVAGQVGRPY